jgi:hypothetical protein
MRVRKQTRKKAKAKRRPLYKIDSSWAPASDGPYVMIQSSRNSRNTLSESTDILKISEEATIKPNKKIKNIERRKTLSEPKKNARLAVTCSEPNIKIKSTLSPSEPKLHTKVAKVASQLENRSEASKPKSNVPQDKLKRTAVKEPEPEEKLKTAKPAQSGLATKLAPSLLSDKSSSSRLPPDVWNPGFTYAQRIAARPNTSVSEISPRSAPRPKTPTMPEISRLPSLIPAAPRKPVRSSLEYAPLEAVGISEGVSTRENTLGYNVKRKTLEDGRKVTVVGPIMTKKIPQPDGSSVTFLLTSNGWKILKREP